MGTLLFAVADADRLRELTQSLADDGHEIVMTGDCHGAIVAVATMAPAAVVADAAIAARDDFEACRAFREMSVAPLIVLAAPTADDEIDELLAFSSGADDYIRMPCSTRVLRARISAAIRRSERMVARPTPPVFTLGTLTVDTGQRRASVADRALHLTRIEFELLVALAENRQQVLTRGEVLSRVWGPWPGDDHVVEVHLSRLRRKILNAGGPRVADAVPGVGYRLGGEAA